MTTLILSDGTVNRLSHSYEVPWLKDPKLGMRFQRIAPDTYVEVTDRDPYAREA